MANIKLRNVSILYPFTFSFLLKRFETLNKKYIILLVLHLHKKCDKRSIEFIIHSFNFSIILCKQLYSSFHLRKAYLQILFRIVFKFFDSFLCKNINPQILLSKNFFLINCFSLI